MSNREKYVCPLCGHLTDGNGFHDICIWCGWESDEVQDDDKDFWGGANDLSFNQYKKQYEEKIKKNPNYMWKKERYKNYDLENGIPTTKFKSYLTEDAHYTNRLEYPIIEEWMTDENIPKNIIPYDIAKTKKDLTGYHICFYREDEYFDAIWKSPKKYLNILNQADGIIGFDYSIHIDMPIVIQHYQTFKNLSLSYFYGSHNIKIIPNIRYGLPEDTDEFLSAIPKNTLIALGTHGFIKTREEKGNWRDELERIINTLEPSGVIVYGSHPKEVFKEFENRTKFYYYESVTTKFWKNKK